VICDALNWEGRGLRMLSLEEEQHVAQCAVCQQARALWQGLLRAGGQGPVDAVSENIRAQVRHALTQAPIAPRWTRAFALAAGAALFPGALAVAAIRRRPDWSSLPGLGIALNLAVLVAAFGLAGRAAFSPGLFPRGRRLAAGMALLAALSLLGFPGARGGVAGGGGLGCFMAVIGVSLLPLLGLFGVLRSRTRSALAGLCAGLAAGALGEAALFVHCPACGLGHLCGAHLTAWGVVALLGAALVLLFPKRIWKPATLRG
jgi:hypothetical protein